MSSAPRIRRFCAKFASQSVGFASACFLAAAVCGPASSTAWAVNKSWTTNNGSWGDAGNWSPAGVPAPGDMVFIGNLPGVDSDTVFLDQNDTIAGLTISDAMGLQTEGHWLVVNGDTLIQGPDSRLVVQESGAAGEFETNNLAVAGANARLILEDSAVIVHGQLALSDGGTVHRLYPSSGYMEFSAPSGTTLSNGGQIRGGPGTMVFQQLHDGLFDLDGPLGTGEIQVSGISDAAVSFIGQGLTDSFSGTVSLGPYSALVMNIAGGWTMDAASTLNVFGAGFGAGARLSGSAATIAGFVDVRNDFRVNAHATLAETIEVEIGATSAMEFVSLWSTDIYGGSYLLGEEGSLEFNGETRVRGGVFTTHSDRSVDGAVIFGGETQWEGDVVVNGIARQVGDVTVTGLTSITADVFDADGDGSTAWQINSTMSLYVDSLDSTVSNSFDGAISVASGFLSSLTVNLTGGFNEWVMAGELNLAGDNMFFINRVGGSRMRVTGDLNLTGVRSQISADLTLDSNSTIHFDSAATNLRVMGATRVAAGAEFVGDGLLTNGAAGALTLADGATLELVGLVNQGLLEVGDSPGIASVDRFENTATGVWLIEIGGAVAGAEHDALIVGGDAALLDGLIEVSVVDLGAGFAPQVGDTFTVLTALAGVEGLFLNEPTSMYQGMLYQWSVIYNPFDVQLQLASVSVPEPASLLLATPLAALGVVALRRRMRARR